MTVPLMILAFFAICIGWQSFGLPALLEQGRPAGPGVKTAVHGVLADWLVYPHEHASQAEPIHVAATLTASLAGLAGFLLATAIYCWRLLNPAEVVRQFQPIYRLLWNKWYFDEIYQAAFVAPVMFISRRVSDFDRRVIDRFVDGCATAVRKVSLLDDFIDRWFVDGAVNFTAGWIYAVGLWLRGSQTGRLRQYVMFIVVGTVGLFVLASFLWGTLGAAN
jgi:NADH:ubiquinone oxidoreductase subunit 5 (subunit L)/multisubunit Na+/H+ antiporter MnhA subunit